eukprot:scaffold114210_cov55-Attheya_sp.AAC.6
MELGSSASEDALEFVKVFKPLSLKGSVSQTLRKSEWAAADPNGNGLLSLAEADAWINRRLIAAGRQDLWDKFRPCYVRAFGRAKDIAAGSTDDYVTITEFRFLNAYICIYAAMLDAFAVVDGSGLDESARQDDRRISKEEWTIAYKNVSNSGFVGLANISDPEKTFAAMDEDGAGMVLFKEWCEFLAGEEIDAMTEVGKMLAFRDERPVEKRNKPKENQDKAAPRSTSVLPDAHFKGEAKIKLGAGVSSDAVDFVDCFRGLAQKTEESKKLRKQAWSAADGNNNGLISLAECDGWVKDVLVAKCIKGEADRIWKRYRKCFVHAFNKAKAISKEMDIGFESATSDDYVDIKEFRILIGYLCIFVVMFDAFQLIDGGSAGIDENDDMRIELDEWLASYTKVTDYNLVGLKDMSKPEDVFNAMDEDGGGMVLLGEWCNYLTAKEVEANTLLGQLLNISTQAAISHKNAGPLKKATPKKGKVAERRSSIKPTSKFTGEVKIPLGKGVSADAMDFVDCFRIMVHKTDASKKQRIQAWDHADGNGNGNISLAECDQWVKDILVSKCLDGEGARIWSRYRKCYIHAFNRARNVSEEADINMETATSDDYVDKKEFRLLIGFLCVYVIMFDAFQLVDGDSAGIDENDDFRIEENEWLASYEKVADHNLAGLKDTGDPKATFKAMDMDGGGMVLLGEWCGYLTEKEIEAHTVLGEFLNISTETKTKTHKKGTPLKKFSPSKAKEAERVSAIKPNSRFTGEAMIPLEKGVSIDAEDFVNCFRLLAQKNEHAKKQRIRAWQQADGNRNGLISLAECDQWVKDVLVAKCIKGEGARIWSRYRKCYIHAFNRAKVISDATDGVASDDFVDIKEFRLLVGFLCAYVVLFDAFQLVDGGSAGIDANDDFRIEETEWLASYEKLADHNLVGLKESSDPKAAFKAMDEDGGGMVLLGEWCHYLIEKEIEADTLLGQFLKSSTEAKAETNKKGGNLKKSSPKKKKEEERVTAIKPNCRFTGAVKIELGKGVSGDAEDFVNCFRGMAQKTDEGKKLRKSEWSHADGNHSGSISLAEVDLWVKDILVAKCIKGEGDRIWKRFRKCFIHAFNRAKGISVEKSASDDSIDFKEFRLFISYLCVFAVMFDAFQRVDGGSAGIDKNDDMRIQLDEWLASYQNVMDHTLIGLEDMTSDPKVVFNEMDSDGGGMVLLKEWCNYLANKEVEANTVLGEFLKISG